MLSVLESRVVDAWLFLRASADLLRIDMALRQHGYQAIMTQLDREELRSNATIKPRDIRRARRYGRRIEHASRYNLPRARCLHRSLVLHRWLRQEGLPSELRIGVLKDGQDLKAHAWVELGDQVVNDAPRAIAMFAPLTANHLNAKQSLARFDMRSIRWG